jgi:hypothetical protein
MALQFIHQDQRAPLDSVLVLARARKEVKKTKRLSGKCRSVQEYLNPCLQERLVDIQLLSGALVEGLRVVVNGH